MNKFFLPWLAICIVVVVTIGGQHMLFAQFLVQDTLVISFKQLNQPVSALIDTIIDQRGDHPRLVGMYEKTKYLFVPLDLLILTPTPLSNEMMNLLQPLQSTEKFPRFNIIIDEFAVTKKTNSMLYPAYFCYASMQIYTDQDPDEAKYLGQLLYEATVRKPFFKDNLKNGFEAAANKFLVQMSRDLNRLATGNTNQDFPGLENLRQGKYSGRTINMDTGVDFCAGAHGWITDGEIIFSRREAKNLVIRDGYNIRYRHGDHFEAIEFGLSNDYLFYRIKSNLVLKAKSQIMFGFNRWDDMATTRHKFWDAVIVDYSLSQSVLYNPLDQRAIIVGLGLMENVYYVHSQKVKIQPALMLHLGLKL